MSKGKNQGSKNRLSTGSSSGTTQHPHINRTRSKLPTKRKKQRQEIVNSTTIPPPSEYEQLTVYMPRNSHPSRDPYGGGGRGGYRSRGGGLGHSSRGRGRGIDV